MVDRLADTVGGWGYDPERDAGYSSLGFNIDDVQKILQKSDYKTYVILASGLNVLKIGKAKNL